MTKKKSSTSRGRRPNGMGTVHHDQKHDVWIVRYFQVYPDGTKRRKSKSLRTRDAALEFLADRPKQLGRRSAVENINLALANMQDTVENPPKDAEMLVYFIQPIGGGPIKIGTTANIRRRLAILQGNNPYPLKLLHICAGGHALEAELHRRFKSYRLHGEWFEGYKEITTFIKQLRGEI